ncbi:MAG: hypothetical protein ACOVNP_00590 [Flavobacterium sp.]
MKNSLFALVFIIIANIVSYSQNQSLYDNLNNENVPVPTFNPDKAYPDYNYNPNKVILFRGSILPVEKKYSNYRTFSLELNLPSSVESTLREKKVPYSPKAFSNTYNLFGLKRVTSGEFKITYNLTRFEWVGDEDFIQKTYQNAPSFNIGMESNIEVRDNQGNLIYKKYSLPQVKMYVVNPDIIGDAYGRLVYRIIGRDIYQLMSQFEPLFLYGPNLSIDYVTVNKHRKSKSNFNVDEFNESIQVFFNINNVDRENWGGLFGEAQKYWKGLTEYTDSEDEDLQKNIRQASNYNLACVAMLLGQMDEADKYMEAVKANEKAFLGIRLKYDHLVEVRKNYTNAQNRVEEIGKIEAIQPEPVLSEHQKSQNVFRYYLIENGEVLTNDNDKYIGKVQILTDFPELQDFRTVQTKSGLGQLASQLGSEKSSVRIYREGEKKPKTTNLKKLQYIKDSDGKVFLIGKTGGSTSFIGSNWTNDKRYAAFEEIKSSNNLSLYQEVFPQNEYILKRPTEEEFFSPPLFIGRRKALKKYFEDCPAMIQKIEKGDYDYDGKETFLKIFEDYLALGCGK